MNDSETPRENHFPLTNNSGKLRPEDAPPVSAPSRVKVNVAPRPANKLWTATKWILGVSSCVAVMGAGAVLGNFQKRSPIIKTIIATIGKDPFNVIVHGDPFANYTVESQFAPDKQHAINILLMGCDNEFAGTVDKAGYVHYSPVLDSPGRSDALMVAHVDFDAKTVNILSIPRDTKVHIPRHGVTKINAANAMGGPELAKETITDVFGIPIDYQVTLHFDGFRKVVDALGGVDIDVKKNIDFVDHCAGMNVHLKPGYQHLNGYKAMGYVRFRHTDSDLARADRQHEFLDAIRSKAISTETFMKLPDVMNALTDNLKSDMTIDQMLTLANFARKTPRENIQVATLPSVEGPSYVYMKVRQSAEVVQKMFFSDTGQTVAINAPAYGSDEDSLTRPRLRRRRSLAGDETAETPRTRRKHRRRHSRQVTATTAETPAGTDLPTTDSGSSGSTSYPAPVDSGGSSSGSGGTDGGSSGSGETAPMG